MQIPHSICRWFWLFQNITILHYNIGHETCGDYGGIVDPNNFDKCCASTCGDYCGAPNCNYAPGDSFACCDGGIPENQTCGASGQMAPCYLGKI